MPADLQVFVTPSYILRAVDWTSGPLSYDAARGVLTYRRDRVLAEQTVQFLFPALLDGYAISVQAGDASYDAVREHDTIFLPPVAMFRQVEADVTFDPTAAALPPLVPRTTVRITVRVRPTAEE